MRGLLAGRVSGRLLYREAEMFKNMASIFWGTPFDKNPKYLFLTVFDTHDPILKLTICGRSIA
jgi:hypothetical protein